MERQQYQHGTKQPRPSIPVRSNQQVRKPKVAFRLGNPAWNLSLVLLGGAWAAVFVIALTAVSGLLSPNLSSDSQPLGAASVRGTATTAHASGQSRLPLWLFGAIALSCAAGSILVSKQVNRPPRPRKSSKPKRLAPYIAPEVIEPSFPTTLPEPPHVATVPSFALVPRPIQNAPTAAPFMAPATLMQLAHQVSQAPAQMADVPAPIAPEHKPLDWGEASLADKLDIRKPRSISSLL